MTELEPTPTPQPRRRRKVTIGLLTLAALTTGGGVLTTTSANASGPGTSGSGSSGSGTSSGSGAISPGKAARCTPGGDFDGLITAASSSSVTVRDLFGPSRTYAIDSSTTVHQGPENTISTSKLSGGEPVHIRGTKSGGAYSAEDIDVRAAAIDGSVSSVTASSIEVTDRDGFSRSIVTDGDTTYTLSGKTVSRSTLTAGTVIHAEGRVDGNHTTLDADTVTELTAGSGPGVKPGAAPPAPRGAGRCAPVGGPPPGPTGGPVGVPKRQPAGRGAPAGARSGGPGASGAPNVPNVPSGPAEPSGSATS